MLFTHTPRPPYVPEDYPDQAYFHGDNRQCMHSKDDRAELVVYRRRGSEVVSLTINVEDAHIRAHLDAKELRELAVSLLDAAHALESTSTAQLQAAA